MEKLKSTYQLNDIKQLLGEQCKFTLTALKSAHTLGFTETEAKDVLLSLESKDFEKSMTDFHNNKSWQDVYKKRYQEKTLYIKLKIISSGDQTLLVLSFKEDEGA